jgi:hypothetical protein
VSYAVLCCRIYVDAMLRCAARCCAVLCHAVLRCTALCCAVLCCSAHLRVTAISPFMRSLCRAVCCSTARSFSRSAWKRSTCEPGVCKFSLLALCRSLAPEQHLQINGHICHEGLAFAGGSDRQRGSVHGRSHPAMEDRQNEGCMKHGVPQCPEIRKGIRRGGALCVNAPPPKKNPKP